MKKLFGVVIPVITPFDEKGRVDIESLRSIVDYIIEGGLHGLFLCGTTGEMMLLTLAERKMIAENAVKHTNGRISVFVQVGCMQLRDTIELAQHAYSIGADGIAVVTPSFFHVSDEDIVDYYMTISQCVPKEFPIYMYGIPQSTTNDISPDAAAIIAAKCENIVGIKYSYPDMVKLLDFISIRNGNFSVLTGADNLFANVIVSGGDGTVSGNAMILREYFSDIWEALSAKDYMRAMKLQYRSNRLSKHFFRFNNIYAYKIILQEEGIIRTATVRIPLRKCSEEDKHKLIEALREADYKKVLMD